MDNQFHTPIKHSVQIGDLLVGREFYLLKRAYELDSQDFKR